MVTWMLEDCWKLVDEDCWKLADCWKLEDAACWMLDDAVCWKLDDAACWVLDACWMLDCWKDCCAIELLDSKRKGISLKNWYLKCPTHRRYTVLRQFSERHQDCPTYRRGPPVQHLETRTFCPTS